MKEFLSRNFFGEDEKKKGKKSSKPMISHLILMKSILWRNARLLVRFVRRKKKTFFCCFGYEQVERISLKVNIKTKTSTDAWRLLHSLEYEKKEGISSIFCQMLYRPLQMNSNFDEKLFSCVFCFVLFCSLPQSENIKSYSRFELIMLCVSLYCYFHS